MQILPSFASDRDPFSFPNDDALWLIKYIDQFHLGSGGTQSSSVQVMLQRLPFQTIEHLRQLDKEAWQGLLASQKGALPELRFVPRLVGELPDLHIGDVLQKGRKVGEVPGINHRLTLMPGEADAEERRAGEEIERPSWWDKELPHRVLNPFEYSGITDHKNANVFLKNSRLVVIRRHHSDGSADTYVLPRMTIFKAFYALHTTFANAFGDGRWSDKVTTLLSLNETYGRLRTGVSGLPPSIRTLPLGAF